MTRAALATLGALALVVRLPALVADRHLTFDDGVFGASAVAMRHGGEPFREVFSSQGPLFLPLVWVGDVLGFRVENAPRMVAVLAGLAVAALVYDIGRRLVGPGVGALAAIVATTSGSMLWTTGPLAADGPGIALALAAVDVALAYRKRPGLRLALAFGGLIAAAFAIKSLFAVPAAVVIAWVLLERRAWRHLGAGVAASAVVVVGLALPWGLADVWDQAVAYHLEAAGSRTPGANLEKVFSTLWDRDLLLLALAVSALWFAIHDRLVGRGADASEAGLAPPASRWDSPAGPIVAWLGLIVAVLILEHPLWLSLIHI